MNLDRVRAEVGMLVAGGQAAELITDATRPLVLYRNLPTGGARFGLPTQTDVVVPIPSGYPAALIDLAGLPSDSPLLSRLKGGNNRQGPPINADGRTWLLASYHPHNGGGGPPWDQNKYGFHTYIDHLIAWLHKIA